MGHKVKLITFPESLTVSELENLLSTNGLLPAHPKDRYYDNRMERDIEKFKGKNVKVGYMPDKVVCSYSYNDGSVDEPDPE
jgi:hypothetical protein